MSLYSMNDFFLNAFELWFERWQKSLILYAIVADLVESQDINFKSKVGCKYFYGSVSKIHVIKVCL